MKLITKYGLIIILCVAGIISGCASAPAKEQLDPVPQKVETGILQIPIDDEGNTPLMNAVLRNSIRNVRAELENKFYFAEQGTLLNTVNLDGNSALHLAAENRTEEIFVLIAKSGIDLDIRNTNGFTALHIAVICDDLENVGTLLKAGAVADVTNKTGVTPLIMAGKKGFGDIIGLLLKYGANPNKKDASGKSYADYMSERKKKADITNYAPEKTLGAAITEVPDITRIAPSTEAVFAPELNPKNYEVLFSSVPENCLLIQAVRAQDYSVASKLLTRVNRAAALTERDLYGNTALMYAIAGENHSFISLLTEFSREWIAVANKFRQTPLHAAFATGNHSILLNMITGTTKSVRDINGNTPLSLAIMTKDTALVTRLIMGNAETGFYFEGKNNILMQTVKNEDYETSKKILEMVKTLDLFEQNAEGKTVKNLAGEKSQRMQNLINATLKNRNLEY